MGWETTSCRPARWRLISPPVTRESWRVKTWNASRRSQREARIAERVAAGSCRVQSSDSTQRIAAPPRGRRLDVEPVAANGIMDEAAHFLAVARAAEAERRHEGCARSARRTCARSSAWTPLSRKYGPLRVMSQALVVQEREAGRRRQRRVRAEGVADRRRRHPGTSCRVPSFRSARRTRVLRADREPLAQAPAEVDACRR